MIKFILILLSLFNISCGNYCENINTQEIKNKKDIVIEDDKPNDEDVGTYSLDDKHYNE